MSINKNFFVESQPINWNGSEAMTVRGLSADDISRVLASELHNAEAIMHAIQTRTLVGVDINDAAAVADAVERNSMNAAMGIVEAAPNVLAKIIACAADEPGEWEHVKKLPFPLQVAALVKIAELTFVDGATFKALVGNVLGLVNSFRQQPAPQPAVANGSKTSERKSRS